MVCICTQGCVRGRAGLGRAFAAPAAAPPRRPPPPSAPPRLRALLRMRALPMRPALLRQQPPVSSSAAAPVMRGSSQSGCGGGRRQRSRRAVAGQGGSGQGHARATAGSRRARLDGALRLRRRACWCETACGPSRAGCAAVMPRASSSGSAPACRSRTGIVRLPAQSEAARRVPSMARGRAGQAGAVRLALT